MRTFEADNSGDTFVFVVCMEISPWSCDTDCILNRCTLFPTTGSKGKKFFDAVGLLIEIGNYGMHRLAKPDILAAKTLMRHSVVKRRSRFQPMVNI